MNLFVSVTAMFFCRFIRIVLLQCMTYQRHNKSRWELNSDFQDEQFQTMNSKWLYHHFYVELWYLWADIFQMHAIDPACTTSWWISERPHVFPSSLYNIFKCSLLLNFLMTKPLLTTNLDVSKCFGCKLWMNLKLSSTCTGCIILRQWWFLKNPDVLSSL